MYPSLLMKSIWILLFSLMLPVGGRAATPAIVWEPGYLQPSRPQKAVGSVRVLFWNTRYNAVRGGLPTVPGGVTVLERNLIGLTGSQWAPEIVVFSECKLSMFSEEFRKTWISTFSAPILVPYNNQTGDAGICIFSKFPLEQGVQTAPLDWRPKGLPTTDLTNYENQWSTIPDPSGSGRVRWGYRAMFERTFIAAKFKTPAGSLQILPVHLMNPWSKLSIEYPKFGFAWTLQALRYGSDAPIYNQLQNLLSFAQRSVSQSKATLLMGDFNLPSTWSYGYQQILAQRWQETFPLAKRTTATFPVPSSGETTAKLFSKEVTISMKIDQSFKSPGVDATSVVLPLSGSDHFPIWTVVAP
ncbi:MAG: hypothetical protein K2X47_01965 [Bdellovibrionales bacterium]|nr:hypothetical protein [Bdellovibrionales bacterium]